MRHMSTLRKTVTVLVFLVLAAGQAMPVLSQSSDGIIPDGGTDPASAIVEDNGPAVEKGESAAGESSSIDAGNKYMFLPFAAGNREVDAAAPAASWVTVFYDEFCSYPSGWSRYNYNATGHVWAYAVVDGWCTAKPNGYVNKMNVTTWRTFSLAGALSSRAIIRFKMTTETYYDFFRVEYSCNSGRTFWGTPSAWSGAYGWSTATVSLANCNGASSVRLRLTFQTDASVTSTLTPAVDYVKVQKYW